MCLAYYNLCIETETTCIGCIVNMLAVGQVASCQACRCGSYKLYPGTYESTSARIFSSWGMPFSATMWNVHPSRICRGRAAGVSASMQRSCLHDRAWEGGVEYTRRPVMWHYRPSLSYNNVSGYISRPWNVRDMLQSSTPVSLKHCAGLLARQRA